MDHVTFARNSAHQTPLTQHPTQVVLTTGESQRAGVLVHGEVVQLQLALCIDGEPAGEPRSLSGSASQNPAAACARPGVGGAGSGGRHLM